LVVVARRWHRRQQELAMPGPPVTTDQYFKMPETLLPQELIYGVMRDAAAPTPGHQEVVGKFYVALTRHLERHGWGRVWLSPIDVVLDRHRHLVVQPDLIVFSHQRLHLVRDRVWGAPDLVVEVMSPRPRIGTLDERMGWFAEYGVRECWLVRHLSGEIEVRQFAGGSMPERIFERDEPLRSLVLPAFTESLASILGPSYG
jgi:Uma2 family endonuclease